MGQTTVQDDESVMFGSAKIELGLYNDGLAGLVDIGAANGVEFAFGPKYEIVKFDNTEEWRRYTNADKATISGTIFEVNGDNVARLLAGMVKRENVAGTPTLVQGEVHVLNDTDAVRLDHKMGVKGEVASIKVTNEAGDVTYTRGDDYAVGVDADGYTVIARVVGGRITDGQMVKVEYSYTPYEAIQLDVGGITEQEYLIARLTNTRPDDGKIYQITCWKVALAGDLKWAYNPDDEIKPNGLPITLEAIKDQTRENKEQLFRIYDEQSVVS